MACLAAIDGKTKGTKFFCLMKGQKALREYSAKAKPEEDESPCPDVDIQHPRSVLLTKNICRVCVAQE